MSNDRDTLLLAAAQLHAAGQDAMANRIEAIASRLPGPYSPEPPREPVPPDLQSRTSE